MEKKNLFKNFGSVMESEVLDPQQMDALEGGGSPCASGCKKSCKPGNQNVATEINLPDGMSADQIRQLER